MMTRLVWLRNDLRITDNKALHAACSDQVSTVRAVFIATPAQWKKHDMAPRQAKFIYDNLLEVQKALAGIGIPLIYHQCADFDASVKWLQDYCLKEKVKELFYNRQYEINELRRDGKLEEGLGDKVICKSFDDSVLLKPGSVLNGSLQMYKMYTPFRNAFIQHMKKSDLNSLPTPEVRKKGPVKVDKVPPPFDYPLQDVDETFPAGEEAAWERLSTFCEKKVQEYDKRRDFPSMDGTSTLSPYLAIGVISPRQCLNSLRAESPKVLSLTSGGSFIWLNELIWRDFYRHLIVAYPHLCMYKPFIDWTDRVRWNDNEKHLQAWQQGRTGFPIVDAGMRQLNTLGWMHNRLRMITASFLVKDLLMNWRLGEKHFMSQLLDGDLAANNGGWQWAASTGTDAAPYFRIFNPTTQGQRFDPKGTFIRKWVPELKDVPEKFIHNPHSWPNRGKLNYPLPIVDHSKARLETLAAFEQAKNPTSAKPKKEKKEKK